MSAPTSPLFSGWQRGALLFALVVGVAACGGRSALMSKSGTAGTGTGAAGTSAAGTGAAAPGAAGTGVGGTGAAGTGAAGTGAAGTGAAGTGAAGTGVAGTGAVDAGAAVVDAAPEPCIARVTTPPPGTFSYLSAGDTGTCGLRADGTVECWGEWFFAEPFYAPPTLSGTYKDVRKARGLCVVRSDDEIDCWGQDPKASPPPPGPFVQVATTNTGVCARRADQTVICWGLSFVTYDVPPGFKFETIAGSTGPACGIEASLHQIVCWWPHGNIGEAPLVQVVPGPFREVAAGRTFVCGLHPDGSAFCWNAEDSRGAIVASHPAPAGVYHGLSMGVSHACALRADGQSVCWGDDNYRDFSPPDGTILKSIAAGWYHTCGILLDGTVKCWDERPGCPG